MPKITKRIVDAVEPKSTRAYVWDSAIPGFGLVVQPSGVKSFCYQYRNAEGRTRRTSLGRYGKVTADQARKLAQEYQAKVTQGGDPLGEKQARRAALRVADVLDRYMKSAKFAGKADTTQNTDRGRVERHLMPLLGSKVVDQLTPDDVRRAHDAIRAGKTAATVKTGPRGLARVRGGPGAARMSIRLLKAAFAWAMENGLIKENPAAAVKVGQDGRRDVVLTPKDYQALFDALGELEATRAIRSEAADAIRVIALTGARRGEIAGLRWRHLDFEKSLATLASEEHKTGRKTGEGRTIGLPAAAMDIIRRQPRGGLDDCVFQPAREGDRISLSGPWRLVREKAGLDDRAVLHTLRHSLATSMAVSGAEAAHIMAVMGHKDLATSQKYIHIARDMRAELAEKAASGIASSMPGHTLKSGGTVTAERKEDQGSQAREDADEIQGQFYRRDAQEMRRQFSRLIEENPQAFAERVDEYLRHGDQWFPPLKSTGASPKTGGSPKRVPQHALASLLAEYRIAQDRRISKEEFLQSEAAKGIRSSDRYYTVNWVNADTIAHNLKKAQALEKKDADFAGEVEFRKWAFEAIDGSKGK
ncbi:tyrosine-type recombinase/integrase [Alloalcanivorax marinus]|uniref:tyrosine-type recombinase/integrase n=1 Tax=Alloalcanivorax marinus TaxID=1177169 RepID=UPI0021D05601|nr:site-specific integrase [Alloalcanivorax marinus]MCU5785942.1 Phage integrase [Alloalcanivorax marinus]